MERLVTITSVILVILSVVPVVFSQNDTSPCDSNYSNLTVADQRYLYNTIGDSDEPIQDDILVEGWYRSDEMMPTTPPSGINMCGTRYPIWLNGDHPNGSEPVDRVACLYSPEEQCLDTYDIQIANCVDYYLYYLIPVERNDTAYCFGIGTEGFVPEGQPEVVASLVEVQGQSTNTETHFICNFEGSQTETLLYVVQWFIDGQLHYTTVPGDGPSDVRLHITEDIFVQENFRMGVELACSFTAQNDGTGTTSPTSQRSEGLLIGIEVLTPSLTFDETETNVTRRTIRLRPTVPIGCQGTNPCTLRIIAYTLRSYWRGVCTGLAFQTSICGVNINSDTYNTVIEVPVIANDNGQYYTPLVYDVYLQTEDTTQNRIWGNYVLPSVRVTIIESNSFRYRSMCYAVNDPHFKTFDRRRFDGHTDNTETLYSNELFDTEVQIKYKQCNRNNIRCICGIAIRAGLDVYVYDLCNPFKMGYTYCGDQGRSFTVKWSYSTLKVYFTYGTYLYIYTDFIWFYGSIYLRIYVYPSRLDEDNTRGLCGIYNGDSSDDFHTRDGSSLSSTIDGWGTRNQPYDFLNAWSVADQDDMFSDQFDPSTLRQLTTNICICESNSGTVTGDVPCLSNGEASCRYSGRVLQATNCQSTTEPGRRRRSLLNINSLPAVNVENIVTKVGREKRQTNDGWSSEDASTHCNQTASSSEVYNLCSEEVSSATPGDFVEVCATDIEMTNTTDWVQSSMNNVASDCVEELSRNVTTLSTQGTESSIIDQITNLVCPNNCSSNGVCQNGTCACDAQIGGDDCSIDLSVATSLTELYNGGLCDITQHDCTSATVYGGMFVESENLQYRAEYFEIDASGGRTNGSTFVGNASYITFVELECNMSLTNVQTHHTSENVFLYGFSVSVTNGYDLYSSGKDFYIYDSTCQTVEIIAGDYNFTLITSYCYIDNGCVRHGQSRSGRLCDVCNTTQDTSQLPECQLVGDDGNSDIITKSFVIAAIVGGVLLVALVVITMVVVNKKNSYRMAVGDSKGLMTAKQERGLPNRRKKFQRPSSAQSFRFQ